LDHICDSPIFVVAGISKRIHDGWSHSYPASHRHHRIRGRLIQGRKILEELESSPKKGEVLGKEVVSRARKILPNLTKSSEKKVS